MQNLLMGHTQKERKKTLVVGVWFELFHVFVNQVCGVDKIPLVD